MQITDPIADLLTLIRNASTAKHPSVEIPASNMKKAICQILVDEGYIKGMQVKNDTVQGTIVVTLKYQANGEPVIAGLRRVSKPGLRIYTNCEDMPKVMKGLGTAIISTSKGIMTDKAARAAHVGGEVLAYVQNLVSVKGAANPFMFVVLLVGVQGVAEFLVSGILGGIVARAVHKFLK